MLLDTHGVRRRLYLYKIPIPSDEGDEKDGGKTVILNGFNIHMFTASDLAEIGTKNVI